MDAPHDELIRRATDRIAADRAAKPCDRYEAYSREIDLCADCGWDHRYDYYEVGPSLADRVGLKYVEVDNKDGSTKYVARLPEGARVVEPEGGNA